VLLFTRLGGFYREANTNLAELCARVARVPVDLFRYELMMTLQPVPERVIEEIVDDVFLPLVRQGAAQTS
jgi:hypothetical protein